MATITPYVDRENVHCNRKNGSSRSSIGIPVKQTPGTKLPMSAPRKALGDVGNKTDSVRRSAASKKQSMTCYGSPVKPPVLNISKSVEAFSERQRSSDEEYPPIDVMPTYDDDVLDDYEDIWPKADRLSLDELEMLIKWQPCGGHPLSEVTSEDEMAEEVEDVDPMKYFVAVECMPPNESEEIHSFLDEEPLFEFAPIDDSF